ncbi:GPI mannosyltransferase 4 [Neocloeon triangulifer]|uniref:GPI mannosyltransferase 4 n=1 Tax=Neocloeon triangulifer TaxID=2078957 RepID=UPI00286F3070|nr:GPI mannosyltransferase 4 [Neocloeon triangulifer]
MSNKETARNEKKKGKYNEEIPQMEENNHPSNLKLRTYWLLVALRFFLTILPQNGYVQPDEFFQSVEIVAGDIFELDVNRVWEFNTSFPLRSIALPFTTIGIPLEILKWISIFTENFFGVNLVTPYILMVLPRLVMCCLSLICDFCLWHMCHSYGQNYSSRLVVFASSYCALIFGTRTFSNTFEMILLSVLLSLVLDSMHHSDEVIWREDLIIEKYESLGRQHPVERAKLARLRSSLPSHTVRHCATIAFVTVAGIFNRPTFVGFAAPALFSWLHRGMGSKAVDWSHFHYRIFTLCFFGAISAIIFITADSFYYGYLTLAELSNSKISLGSNFVVTPLNFLMYNSQTSNLKNHGLHPRWLHLVVNVPLMFGMLGIAGYMGVVKIGRFAIMRKWSQLPKAQSVTSLMNASFIVPLLALSIFPHQEPRFLLPLVIPLTFLHAQFILNYRKWLKKSWYVLNALAVLFFGFFHQGGVWFLASHLRDSGLAHPKPLNAVHLVTSQIYIVPRFPMLVPSPAKVYVTPNGRRYKITRRFHVHETGLSGKEVGVKKAHKVLQQCKKDWKNHRLKCRVFCAFPGTVDHKFEGALRKYNMTQKPHRIRFYPHLSTEAMPQWKRAASGNLVSSFTKTMAQLGLILTEVELLEQ